MDRPAKRQRVYPPSKLTRVDYVLESEDEDVILNPLQDRDNDDSDMYEDVDSGSDQDGEDRYEHGRFDDGQDDEEETEPDDEADPADIVSQMAQVDQKLKNTFESIFEKYEKDFDGLGDEIDLRTGNIVVNNGHLEGMMDERDPGDDWEDEDEDITEDTEGDDEKNIEQGRRFLRAITEAPEAFAKEFANGFAQDAISPAPDSDMLEDDMILGRHGLPPSRHPTSLNYHIPKNKRINQLRRPGGEVEPAWRTPDISSPLPQTRPRLMSVLDSDFDHPIRSTESRKTNLIARRFKGSSREVFSSARSVTSKHSIWSKVTEKLRNEYTPEEDAMVVQLMRQQPSNTIASRRAVCHYLADMEGSRHKYASWLRHYNEFLLPKEEKPPEQPPKRRKPSPLLVSESITESSPGWDQTAIVEPMPYSQILDSEPEFSGPSQQLSGPSQQLPRPLTEQACCPHVDCSENPHLLYHVERQPGEEQSAMCDHLLQAHNITPYPCCEVDCEKQGRNGFFTPMDLVSHVLTVHSSWLARARLRGRVDPSLLRAVDVSASAAILWPSAHESNAKESNEPYLPISDIPDSVSGPSSPSPYASEAEPPKAAQQEDIESAYEVSDEDVKPTQLDLEEHSHSIAAPELNPPQDPEVEKNLESYDFSDEEAAPKLPTAISASISSSAGRESATKSRRPQFDSDDDELSIVSETIASSSQNSSVPRPFTRIKRKQPDAGFSPLRKSASRLLTVPSGTPKPQRSRLIEPSLEEDDDELGTPSRRAQIPLKRKFKQGSFLSSSFRESRESRKARRSAKHVEGSLPTPVTAENSDGSRMGSISEAGIAGGRSTRSATPPSLLSPHPSHLMTPRSKSTNGDLLQPPGQGMTSKVVIRTPGGSFRECGKEGFVCDRSFCLRCVADKTVADTDQTRVNGNSIKPPEVVIASE